MNPINMISDCIEKWILPKETEKPSIPNEPEWSSAYQDKKLEKNEWNTHYSD